MMNNSSALNKTFTSSDFGGHNVFFRPYVYPVTNFWETILQGYVTLCIAVVVIIGNTLMVTVFIRSKDSSPSTILLGSLAVSDAFMCLMKLPDAIYFHIMGNYTKPYIPYKWCVALHVKYILHQILRISTNWLTAFLGLQRCFAVCLPFKIKRICSTKFTICAVVVIVVCAVLLNIYEILAIHIQEVRVYSRSNVSVQMPSACIRTFSKSFVELVGDINKSQTVFFVFAGLTYRVFPVGILCVTTILIAYFLSRKTPILNSMESTTATNKSAQNKRITQITFAIMVAFLIAEIQDGIAFFIYAVEHSSDQKRKILPLEADIIWDNVSTIMSMIGYACNFWIFVIMSKKFRSALTKLMCKPCKNTSQN